jgi:ankyrin repeat protein
MIRLLFIFLVLSVTSYGQSIHDLARSGDVVAMKKLLDEQPNQVNQLSDQGLSPFLLAAYRGNNDAAKLLVERGADVKTCFSEGSAIYGVIYKNNFQMLELLLKQGVSVNDTCQFDQFGSPLHFAMNLRRYELIERILQENPNMELLDQNGKSINQLLTIYNDEKLNKIFKSHEK